MLRSLLHYQSSTLLGLVGLAALALSFEVHSGIGSQEEASRAAVMNVGYMSSEELIANAGDLSQARNPLDEAEMSQRLMNAQWLEDGMEDSADYYEGNDALEELAETALKSYWDALVKRDRSYQRYTPVVHGEFSSSSNKAEYKVRLSGDTLKFKVEYAF